MLSGYVLKELAPLAGITSTLHTNNVGQTSTGSVFIVNRGTNDDRVSVAMVSNGNVLTNNCFICYQTTVNYGHRLYLQQLALNSQDSIQVISINGTSTFIYNGQTTG